MRIGGILVYDAKQRVQITIRPRDVRAGSVKDPGACAAALACKRELHATEARVHIGRTYVKIGGKWIRFKTPEALRTEIVAFDRGGEFAPGEYILKPMASSERLGRKKKRGPHITKGTRRTTRHVLTDVRPHGANR